jgi:hypothetical protein
MSALVALAARTRQLGKTENCSTTAAIPFKKFLRRIFLQLTNET